MFQEATEIRNRLAALVDRLDPDAVSGTAARDLWGLLDASERLCAAGKTLLARRIAQTHRPETVGVKSAAEDLARRAGTTVGAARDAVETSARLPELPLVEAALRRGDLSPAQAAAVSAAAAAAADPATEARLVELAASASLPELREEAARVAAAADPDPEATNRRLHRRRALRRFTGTDGAWTLIAKGTPQAGAAINTALDQIIDQIFAAARRDGRREAYEAYAFDALLTLVKTAHGTPAPPTGGADNPVSLSAERAAIKRGPAAEPPPVPAGSSRPNPRFLALLRIDIEALRRGAVAGQELCEIKGVGPVPVPVAAGLLGQAVLKLVITRGVDVLNVTHLGRGPTAAQKIALAWASPGCTVAGCWRTRVEHDHRQPWKDTRHTRLDELDPLCEFHHDLKTRHGWALVAGTGKRPMVPPDDPRHPRHHTQEDRSAGPDRTASHDPAPGIDTTHAPDHRRGRRRTAAPEQRALPALPSDPSTHPQPP
ncbi:MAG TPA: HNH endonuclease signature motif containing protein [Jiangellaceae bacterium]